MLNKMNMNNKIHKCVSRNSQINLSAQEFDYPEHHLSMDCFWCEMVSGDLVMKEHEAAKWLDEEMFYSVDWLPADVLLIEKIKVGL